jgi:hypothetical protein
MDAPDAGSGTSMSTGDRGGGIVGLQTFLLAVTSSPAKLVPAVAGVALFVWTSVDLWRNRAYSTSNRIGWQLVIGGLSVGPLVNLGDGWFLGFPVGAFAYILLAGHGPLRRRLAPQPAQDVTRPAQTSVRPRAIGSTSADRSP